MTAAVLLGMGFGLGLWLLARILLPVRTPLAEALARVDAAAVTPSVWRPASTGPERVAGRWGARLEAAEWLLGERVAGQLADRGVLGAELRADLALLGVDERAYTARKVLLAAGVLVVSPLVLTPAAVVLGVPWLLGAWVSMLAALVAFVAPDMRVRRVARRRRQDFTAAIAAYLDLVALRAASGSGVSEALRDAATVGAGEAFIQLRAALDDARLSGVSPARGLGQLGVELGIVELRQLAAQLQLVDSSGAQAESSLRAKAEALRGRQLADAHGGANERTQTMQVGHVLLGLGFLLFIGWPAVAAVLSL